MGAFDAELAALGYSTQNTGLLKESPREQVAPAIGEIVEFWHPVKGGGYHMAQIKYVSEELVVVRYREPQKSKWRPDYFEEALNSDTTFYKARGADGE